MNDPLDTLTNVTGDQEQATSQFSLEPQPKYFPIPGLAIEVRVLRPDGSEEAYPVLTNRDGRPGTQITVESNVDILISSQNPHIARFEVSGPASEFSSLKIPRIAATPMIISETACREVIEGSHYVRFIYRNLNTSAAETLLPISSYSALHIQDPLIPTDDLLLNDVRSYSHQTLVPKLYVRSIASGDILQSYLVGRGSFSVPYDLQTGSLTWSLIGRSIVVTKSTPLCESQTQPRPMCEVLSAKKRKSVYTELLRTVGQTLKDASGTKRGNSSALKVPTSATQPLKRIVKTVSALKGVHICPPGASIEQSCKAQLFPRDALLKLHGAIFRKYRAKNPKAFKKIQQKYLDQYHNFLRSTFPDKVYRCPPR